MTDQPVPQTRDEMLQDLSDMVELAFHAYVEAPVREQEAALAKLQAARAERAAFLAS